jgi:hypothetical protein
MKKEDTLENTQFFLTDLFEDPLEEKSFVENDYFIKNKDKYFTQEMLDEQQQLHSIRLKYLDSFLTRYAYYSF